MRNALATLLLACPALAQESVPQPAESAKSRARTKEAAAHQPSYEAPAVGETVVRGERLLFEEERIGAYAQPRWTAARRFPTTRVYVVPAGTLQLEWWLERKSPFDDWKGGRYRSQWELEVGLGKRLQLDLYLTTEQKGEGGTMALHREKVELRWALADWGVLPANPTLYFELVRQHDGPPLAEVKGLFGGELSRGWHWGANLVFETELGGEHQNEYAITGGVSKTIRDNVFSVGAEARLQLVDAGAARLDFTGSEVLLGPSLQWRPTPAVHVDLVVLLGVETERSGADSETRALLQPLLVVGYEL